MLMLESLEFVHGVVTHLLQFFLVLSVNFILDVLPVLSVHLLNWLFSLDFHSWANNNSRRGDSLDWSVSNDLVKELGSGCNWIVLLFHRVCSQNGSFIDIINIINFSH
jgi:hypothetical protein